MSRSDADFFESQERALRLSRRLIVFFGLAVASMVVVVYAVLLLAIQGSGPGLDGWFHPEMLLAVAAGMLLVIGGGTALRTAQLRKGGGAVAELLGGREVDPETRDPAERRLWNVVEEMAIASGTPVPGVYVLDGETGINAFAAGHSIHDAAVAVTRGTLETLDRDELQGVVAHEFSHILNGDMRLNLRLVGLLFGIFLLTVIGRGILRGAAFSGGGRRGGKGGGGAAQAAILGLVLVVLGFLGVFFGRLIQSAVSRQREYLADAAAVQFTRNPAGIAGALKKIGGNLRGSQIQDHHAQEVGHLFFADGMRGAFSRAFATHPPLEERIWRLDPSWDGEFVDPAAERSRRRRQRRRRKGRKEGGEEEIPFPVAAALVTLTGSLGAEHVAYARALLSRVPDDVRAALRSPEGAAAVVLALVAGEDESSAEDEAVEGLPSDVIERARKLRGPVRALGAPGRLPLVDLALPALKRLPPPQVEAFRSAILQVCRKRKEVRTFDFALYHVLRRGLPAPGEDLPERAGDGAASLDQVRDPVEVILSAVARSGEGDPEEAFRAGAAHLPGDGWSLRPEEGLGIDAVDEALTEVEAAAPGVRRAVLEGVSGVVAPSGDDEVESTELLRAVAEALDAPLPPAVTEAREARVESPRQGEEEG